MPTCCRADSISIDPFKNDHHLKPKYMVLKKVLTQVGFYVKTSVGRKLRKKQFRPDSPLVLMLMINFEILEIFIGRINCIVKYTISVKH